MQDFVSYFSSQSSVSRPIFNEDYEIGFTKLAGDLSQHSFIGINARAMFGIK